MKNKLLFTILITLLFSTNCFSEDSLRPNKLLTPGMTRVVTKEEICNSSTKLVRKTTTQMKNTVYKEYNLKQKTDSKCTGPSNVCYEVDHLIPLGIGGADNVNNLWIQSYDNLKYTAHDKDKLEFHLHNLICKNTISIEEAQSCIANDWILCYEKYFK